MLFTVFCKFQFMECHMDHPFLAEVVPRTEGCKLDTGTTLVSECILFVFSMVERA